MAKLTPEELAARPHLFKKGQSGNPAGIPREVAQRTRKNAAKAAELREKFLDTLESRIKTVEVMAEKEANGNADEASRLKSMRVMEILNADVNRLMTDSENRGFGAPKQQIDLEDRRDKSLEDMTDEELAAIASGNADAEEDSD